MNPIYNCVDLTAKQKRWLAVRSREAKKIDPATAKICWMWTPAFDPYFLVKAPPQESEIQRTYFAHRANCKILVWFGDLPAFVEQALRTKHKESIEHSATIPDLEWITPEEREWLERLVRLVRVLANCAKNP